jgi:hypothetical protein
LAFELTAKLKSLLNNLKNRKNEHFINTEIEILIDVIEGDYLVKKNFDINCQKFHDLCITYIQKYIRHKTLETNQDLKIQ